jgi:hypothetical protein
LAGVDADADFDSALRVGGVVLVQRHAGWPRRHGPLPHRRGRR